MKLFAVVLAALAMLAGFAGGFTAFSSAATPVATQSHVAAFHRAKPKVVRPAPVVRWAPCKKPAVLEGHACVTHVVHTVTMPAPAAPAAPTAAQPAASTPAPYQPAAAAQATSPRPSAPTTHVSGGEDGGGGGGGGHDD